MRGGWVEGLRGREFEGLRKGPAGLLNYCITQHKAQGPSRTCSESTGDDEEEEEEEGKEKLIM